MAGECCEGRIQRGVRRVARPCRHLRLRGKAAGERCASAIVVEGKKGEEGKRKRTRKIGDLGGGNISKETGEPASDLTIPSLKKITLLY